MAGVLIWSRFRPAPDQCHGFLVAEPGPLLKRRARRPVRGAPASLAGAHHVHSLHHIIICLLWARWGTPNGRRRAHARCAAHAKVGNGRRSSSLRRVYEAIGGFWTARDKPYELRNGAEQEPQTQTPIHPHVHSWYAHPPALHAAASILHARCARRACGASRSAKPQHQRPQRARACMRRATQMHIHAHAYVLSYVPPVCSRRSSQQPRARTPCAACVRRLSISNI